LASPDAADAIAVTFAYPLAHRESRPLARRVTMQEGGGVNSSWMSA
jgi:hypothetical protein